jgi:alpha-mannosidase
VRADTSAVDGNVMRLSLLRGPTMPDPDCDMGKHEFSFAIYPHVGTYIESDVTPVAYAFNAPMRRECRQLGRHLVYKRSC